MEFLMPLELIVCSNDQIFYCNEVNDDLLLDLNEDNLKYDLGINNGIFRKMVERELDILRKNMDFTTNSEMRMLNEFNKVVTNPSQGIYIYKLSKFGVMKLFLFSIKVNELEKIWN